MAKEYWAIYSLPAECPKCPPDEYKFLIIDYGDRILSYQNGIPTLYDNWNSVYKSIPADAKIQEEQ